jgi:hypothetical protein
MLEELQRRNFATSTIRYYVRILTHSMWMSLRDRDPHSLSPYESMLRCFGALEILSIEELSLAADALEHAIQHEPNHSGCLAMLSVVYSQCFGMSVSPCNRWEDGLLPPDHR